MDVEWTSPGRLGWQLENLFVCGLRASGDLTAAEMW